MVSYDIGHNRRGAMHNPLITPLILMGLITLLFGVERIAPLRVPRHALFRRMAVNVGVSLIALATAAALVRPATARVLDMTAGGGWGIAPLLPLPEGARAVTAFLLMDLSFYYWHRANHRIPFLWRFHNAHHIDPDLDVTTAYRFHFGEVALSALFRVAQISVIGVSAGTFAVYELVFQANTLFQHSNVRLPLGLERLINLVTVTPRMHGIHHSRAYREANANYSVVFSWWDRLHRTLRLNVPQAEITIGIAGYSKPRDNTLRQVLSAPFRRQRPYWRVADGAVIDRSDAAAHTGMQE